MLLTHSMQSKNIRSAVSIFEDMKDHGFRPNKVTYSMLISALSKHKRRGSRSKEMAYMYWKEMEKAHPRLDPAALRIGMKACVNMGKIEEAEAILSSLESIQRNPDVRTYNILIKGYAKIGDMKALHEIFGRIVKVGLKPSVATYNAVIASHMKKGQMKEAEDYLQLAHADGIIPDAWTYTTLIKGYIEHGDYQRARQIWREMKEADVKPTTISYSVMVDGYIKMGDFARAQQLVNEMIQKEYHPPAIVFNSLLQGYVSTGNPQSLEKALGVLDDMQSQGVAPLTDTFNTLMSAAVSADDTNLAFDLYDRMLKNGQYPDGLTYTILIQVYARQGRLTEAVSIFETLTKDPNASIDIAAYNAMVDAFSRSGEMAAAEKMLERAQNFATKCGREPPVEAYGAVVAGYVRLKLVNPAVDTVKKFHAIGGTPDLQMLDQLIDLCVRSGEFKVAMQAVRAMELMGAELDKGKYRSMVEYHERKEGSGASRQDIDSKKKRDKGMYLERFKFWLGLPNSYYGE